MPIENVFTMRSRFHLLRLAAFISKSRGHGSLTPSHANEAMEFRPEENAERILVPAISLWLTW